MIVSLSHKLSESTPFFEGLEKPALDRLYDLGRGDDCNSFYLRTSNHCGTHVDGPWHFNPSGRKICDYDIAELIFTRPAILDLPVEPAHLIRANDLDGLSRVPKDTNIVLLRTGFGRRRAEERTYVDDGPGFSRDAAERMLDELPQLRALAVDFISLAAFRHQTEGADAHRVFLGCAGYSDRTVLLIEDAKLAPDLTTPARVIVVPWYFEGLDSAPCTLLAEFAEERA